MLGPPPDSPLNVQSPRLKFAEALCVLEIRVAHQQPNGQWREHPPQQYVAQNDQTLLLPYDPCTDQVVLLEQYFVGTHRQPEGPWHLGLIESAPEQTVELLTSISGHEPIAIETIGDCYLQPGQNSQRTHLLCAGIMLATTPAMPNTVLLSTQDAIEALDGNYLQDAALIITLHWLRFHRLRLQQQWR